MNTVFLFVISSLATFRVTRLVTSDKWPPSMWFRDRIEQRFGEESSWMELFTCPWCLGAWFSAAMTAFLDWYIGIPLPIFWAFATSAVVGYLGAYAE